ncbi:malectin domain-containing carbohydrate-binding protein [Kineococcus indalonis]|uniref:malectin domain-containing carbohydrate-binding protein n=1 Tax=Kineococcus indalonis TaxID=2696566 RepID=UPI001412018E|nr:malectin domain-containing carbohydrate-binding protein [Kineococcus indalonis]NAZ88302.1 hypothetical protein [Kineococcus indalonis]
MSRSSVRRLAAAVSAAALAGAGVALAAPAQAAAYDLVVTDVRPAQPGVQATGSYVAFEATIKNAGTAATPAGIAHGVAFTVNGRAVTWDDTSRDPLAPGASRVIRATGGPAGSSYWQAGTGQFTLGATVDDVNRIKGEANESNNTRTAPLTVTPLKPVSTIIAAPASTQKDFEANHSKAVTVSWAPVPGQPVGAAYSVSELPAYDTCSSGGPVWKSITASNSMTFEMTAGAQCGNSGEVYITRYQVTTVGTHGAQEATNWSTVECEWSNHFDRYRHYQQSTGLGCTGQSGLFDFEDPTWALIDAGAAAPTRGWEGDSGYDKGSVHYADFPGLSEEQKTSRWGWSRYEARVTDQYIGYPNTARLTFVEPTFTRAGQRVFDVKVNGKVVATNLDIFAKVGRGKPYIVQVPVDATNGAVTIEATKKVDNPIIATIEVVHG